MAEDPAPPVDTLRLPAAGWWRWVPGSGATLVRRGHRLELPWRSAGMLSLELDDLVGVELRPERARTRRYEVVLDAHTGRRTLAGGLHHLAARTVAERLARWLDLRLQDFTGRELAVRVPGELDRPLELPEAPALPGAPPGGASAPRVRAEVLELGWAAPSVSLGGLGLLVALGGLAVGSLPLSGAGVAVVLAALGSRVRVQVGPGGVRVSRGPGGRGLSESLPRDEIEQLGVDAEDPERLVIVSDRRIVELVHSPEVVDWLRRALPWALAGCPGGGEGILGDAHENS